MSSTKLNLIIKKNLSILKDSKSSSHKKYNAAWIVYIGTISKTDTHHQTAHISFRVNTNIYQKCSKFLKPYGLLPEDLAWLYIEASAKFGEPFIKSTLKNIRSAKNHEN